MKRRSISFAILLLVLIPSTAAAHANLVRSNPGAGQILQVSPTEITLEFTEDLDGRNTRVDLFNSKNELVAEGPGTVVNPRLLVLKLGDLPEDSYTAAWRARSATDGHFTEGNIPFGIGVVPDLTSLVPPYGYDPATPQPPIIKTTTRWLNLLAAAAAFGPLSFALFVWGKLKWKRGKQDDLARKNGDQLIRKITLVGCAAFIASNLFLLFVQASELGGDPVLALSHLLATVSGSILITRLALTLLIAGFVLIVPNSTGRKETLAFLIPLALIALFTQTMSSHSAALGSASPFAVFVDWLHLVAMVAWLGGLPPLLLIIRRVQAKSRVSLSSIIPRFSELAIICVFVLAVTGFYSYTIHVGNLELLWLTTYGRTILIKSVLFGGLLILGAYNLRFLTPRLKRLGNSLLSVFKRTISLEVAAGILLLFAVGAMTSIATSQSAWNAHQLMWVNFQTDQARVDGVVFKIYIAPGRVGTNAFVVDIEDVRPNAQSAAGELVLRITKIDDDLGTLQIETVSNDGKRFSATGPYLALPGFWQVEVILRRAGFNDARTTFEFQFQQ